MTQSGEKGSVSEAENTQSQKMLKRSLEGKTLKNRDPEKPTSLLKVTFHVITCRYSHDREVVKRDKTYHKQRFKHKLVLKLLYHIVTFNGVYIESSSSLLYTSCAPAQHQIWRSDPICVYRKKDRMWRNGLLVGIH